MFFARSRSAISLLLREQRTPHSLLVSASSEWNPARLPASIRFFSDGGPKKPKDTSHVDLFGVHEDHGPDGVGERPPLRSERRNLSSSGELSDSDKALLHSSDDQKEDQMVRRLQEHLATKATPKDFPLNRAGRRIRETEAALTSLGRSPAAVSSKEPRENQDGLALDEPLSEKEFSSFSKYLKENQDIESITPDDIPTQESSSSTFHSSSFGSDEDELAARWLTARAERQMDDTIDDNPYSDTMPGDLSPSNLVNRRRAKKIPKQLLHHQNLHLLQTFLDPTTALIRPRVQTRLGARDQRKIAKLVKRSRALGLIPNVGQFKVERTGWIHDRDIDRNRKWETKLEEAGLSLPKVTAEQLKESLESSSLAPPTK